MSSLNIILGAGFSYHAGIPLIVDINSKFNRINKRNIHRISSGEWMWANSVNSDPTSTNNIMGVDDLAGGYLLDEIVSDYIQFNNTFENYELLYQYIFNQLKNNSGWSKKIINKALDNYNSENKQYGDQFKFFLQNSNENDIAQMINLLISDIFRSNKTEEQIIEKYDIFIDFIMQYDKINVFTLNHDLFLEYLLNLYSIPFTNGFSEVYSEIEFDGKKQKIFQNIYSDSGVRIYKLHGSVDMIPFEVMEQNGLNLKSTGETIYFIPDGYHAIHGSVRVDTNSNNEKPLQDFQPNFTSFIISGSEKLETINKDYMLKEMNKTFKDEMKSTDDLLIIGFSFNDEHIKEIIENCIVSYEPFIININPEIWSETKSKNIIHLRDISELNSKNYDLFFKEISDIGNYKFIND